MPFLCRGIIYSMSDFIIYNCFIIWTVTIVLPYNYLVDKVKSVLIEVHSEGGIEKVKFFLYTVTMFIMVLTGIIVRKIYDCFYNDWYTYTILMIVVYLFGRKTGDILLIKLWDFWREVYAERTTDMARRRYDRNRAMQYHTVVYDIDTMF